MRTRRVDTLDGDKRDWARSFDLDVTAMYRMTRALLPRMLACGIGVIVDMARLRAR